VFGNKTQQFTISKGDWYDVKFQFGAKKCEKSLSTTLKLIEDGHTSSQKDSHAIGAQAFKDGTRPDWPNNGL